MLAQDVRGTQVVDLPQSTRHGWQGLEHVTTQVSTTDADNTCRHARRTCSKAVRSGNTPEMSMATKAMPGSMPWHSRYMASTTRVMGAFSGTGGFAGPLAAVVACANLDANCGHGRGEGDCSGWRPVLHDPASLPESLSGRQTQASTHRRGSA